MSIIRGPEEMTYFNPLFVSYSFLNNKKYLWIWSRVTNIDNICIWFNLWGNFKNIISSVLIFKNIIINCLFLKILFINDFLNSNPKIINLKKHFDP